MECKTSRKILKSSISRTICLSTHLESEERLVTSSLNYKLWNFESKLCVEETFTEVQKFAFYFLVDLKTTAWCERPCWMTPKETNFMAKRRQYLVKQKTRYVLQTILTSVTWTLWSFWCGHLTWGHTKWNGYFLGKSLVLPHRFDLVFKNKKRKLPR